MLAGREKSFRDAIYASHTRDGDMNIFPHAVSATPATSTS